MSRSVSNDFSAQFISTQSRSNRLSACGATRLLARTGCCAPAAVAAVSIKARQAQRTIAATTRKRALISLGADSR
jgi:hypothetical protein